jgi:hypothetical protein
MAGTVLEQPVVSVCEIIPINVSTPSILMLSGPPSSPFQNVIDKIKTYNQIIYCIDIYPARCSFHRCCADIGKENIDRSCLNSTS